MTLHGINLVVADTGNDRIQFFSATGSYLAKVGAHGSDSPTRAIR